MNIKKSGKRFLKFEKTNLSKKAKFTEGGYFRICAHPSLPIHLQNGVKKPTLNGG
jgi:hypothetical protein